MVASPFSPAGRSAERRRGDEGASSEAGASKIAFGPPHPALRATFSPLGRRGSVPHLTTTMISTEFCI